MLFSFKGSRAIAAVILMAPTVACALQTDLGSELPEGLEVGWFYDDCAPWDGPALSLNLSHELAASPFQSSFPHLRVTLYASRTRFPRGERMYIEIPGNQGHASYCESEETCETATSVAIEFSRLDSEELAGRLEVTFPNHAPIRGAFRAARMPFQALCG